MMHKLCFAIGLMYCFAGVILADDVRNAKLQKFDFPKHGFSIYFPKETKKKVESDTLIRYYFEKFDTGGKNIGSAMFSFYPVLNTDENNLIAQIKDDVKHTKVGDAVVVGEVEYKIRRGFYYLMTIKSEYSFKDKDFTVKREDYFYLTYKGIVHITFLIPSYNCYLTEYDRQLISYNSFDWYDWQKTDHDLNIQYTMRHGIFKAMPKTSPSTLSFRSVSAKYKSEIDIIRLLPSSVSLAAAAEKYFGERKKIPGITNWASHKTDSLKREYIACTYQLKHGSDAYTYNEYVIVSKGVYYAVRLKATCSDIDACDPQFQHYAENFIQTIETRQANPTPPTKPAPVNKTPDEEDNFSPFGY